VHQQAADDTPRLRACDGAATASRLRWRGPVPGAGRLLDRARAPSFHGSRGVRRGFRCTCRGVVAGAWQRQGGRGFSRV